MRDYSQTRNYHQRNDNDVPPILIPASALPKFVWMLPPKPPQPLPAHSPINLPPTKPVQIVSFESLKPVEVKDATFVWLNRESTAKQKGNHVPKRRKLEEAKRQLCGDDFPFDYSQFTGCGILNESIHTTPTAYFVWLRDRIQEGLDRTIHGNLYVVFHSEDRLMRPADFNPKDVSTWDLTANDVDLFGRWLRQCFDERAENIVFVLLHDESSEIVRGIQAKMGMIQKGNFGGRPRSLETAADRKRFKKILHDEAIELARHQHMNAADIKRYFERQYQAESFVMKLPGKRRIQQMLKEADCPSNPGRPKKSAAQRTPPVSTATEYAMPF